MSRRTIIPRLLGIAAIALATGTGSVAAQPYLSKLEVRAGDPLFATYAAPLERSQFVVDEGYRFQFDQEGSGIDFTTDTAGSLSLAFKMNGVVRFNAGDMHVPTVVTTSYSDLVRYHYEPFEDVRVDVHFQVYSSRLALQDVQVTNSGGEPITLGIYPFLRHAVENAALSDDGRAFTFEHIEQPDGWTTSHGLPYAADLQNVLLMDDPPDAFGAYTAVGTYSSSKQGEAASAQNYAVEWGEVHHADGSLCRHSHPDIRQTIVHDGSWHEILTESAPKWGDTDPNVPGNGFQGAELGNFADPEIAVGDSFAVVFTCLATGQQGVGRGVITTLPDPDGIHVPVQLAGGDQPPAPDDLAADIDTVQGIATLTWTPGAGVSYDLYRRPSNAPGRFVRIADALTAGEYVDETRASDIDYAYTLVPRRNGDRGPHSLEAGGFDTSPLFADIESEQLDGTIPPLGVRAVAFQKTITLAPGETRQFRIVRGVDEASADGESLRAEAESLLDYDIETGLQEAEARYTRIPDLEFADPLLEATYWNAFSLMRQVMLPPEGEAAYNYYVFSREPTWGWGHGGQVFHESLTMLAYAYMDPESAMDSQRIYMERQQSDGYINYRSGSYLNETIPTNGERTTSAPWYNWINWELYKLTQDSDFLEDAYASGALFYNWWLQNRDKDEDGLAEWGAHAVLESVRDGKVAVWDDAGWPSNFEAVDLNSMLVKEATSLASMAEALGDSAAAARWSREAADRTQAINDTFWDSETGFYYHVDLDDHDFTYENPDDLKRQEIIGFLPLWAGIATPEQAERLIEHLSDEQKFWRPYGIPSLAADDPYYDPMGYWNGPVWVEWQYLIFRGLLDYGRDQLAAELADRVIENVTHHLAESHTFWELYSPDALEAGHHQTYIWTGLVARMMLDLESVQLGSADPPQSGTSTFGSLESYPNPFDDSTTIQYRLPAPSHVELSVFDARGSRVAMLVDAWMPAGLHELTWKAAAASSGVYFCRLDTEGSTTSTTLLRIR